MGVSLRERFSRISHWLFDSVGTSSYSHPRKKPQLALTGTPALSAKIPSRPSKGLKELLGKDDPNSRSHYIHQVQIGLPGK